LDRINLFGGNDVGTEPGLVPVAALAASGRGVKEDVVPAHDTLFTSATLGRYSPALNELQQHQARELAETAAD